MSETCGHKGCERPAKRLGIQLRASDGDVIKALVDLYYCSPHSQHVSIDHILGRDGWSALRDHFLAMDGTPLIRENCQIYLVDSR